jgi:methylphosphotriester-DNA--protein-cysteine methyltransferase
MMRMSLIDIFLKRNQEKEKPPEPPKEREPQSVHAEPFLTNKETVEKLQAIETKLDEHDKKTEKGFSDLTMTSEKLLQQFQELFPTVPTRTRDMLQALASIGESHKRVINALLDQENPEDRLTYQELAERLGMRESSVRGMVHDLRQVGFQFTIQTIGRKVAIGLSRDLLQQLLVEKPRS